MILTFRPLATSPAAWKPASTTRPYSPFSATYSQTLDLLDKELRHLGATDAWLQVELSDPIRGVRNDGQIRANATVVHPGVILTIQTRDLGTLVYDTDAYQGGRGEPGWQANLRAIALGLEALRKVERYGIANRGQQYAGFRELGSGTAAGGQVYQPDGLARFLARAAGWDEEDLSPTDADAIRHAYRDAAEEHHPDREGGSTQMMAAINVARDALLAGAS